MNSWQTTGSLQIKWCHLIWATLYVRLILLQQVYGPIGWDDKLATDCSKLYCDTTRPATVATIARASTDTATRR